MHSAYIICLALSKTASDNHVIFNEFFQPEDIYTQLFFDVQHASSDLSYM